MKKAARAILIVFLVIIIALIIAVVLNRDYINIFITSITNNSETIKEKEKDTNDTLINELNNYLDEKLREPTDDENLQVENGELDVVDLYYNIIRERIDEEYWYNIDTKEMTVKEPDEETSEEEKHLYSQKDTIVSKYVTQLYTLQSAYSSKIEQIISQAISYYNDLRATQDQVAARANTIAHFTSTAASLEGECDDAFEQIIKEFDKELKNAGEDTSILKTMRKAYEDEKQLKMSYYINKYIK